MSLDNLAKIGRLKPHSPTRAEIGDLLAAAHRNLQDARAGNISTENRFDAAYKCIMQAALASSLMPRRCEAPSSKPSSYFAKCRSGWPGITDNWHRSSRRHCWPCWSNVPS